ncbi:MAG: D-2-hydroxyacid dehydrogenase [Bacteroidota bacterium]
MARILVNDGIHVDGKDVLEDAGFEVVVEKVPQEKLPEVLPGFDVIVVRSATKVRKDLIDLCPNLKMIARGGVGLDNIDTDYARSKGIEVINTPKSSSQSVAELTIGHMFSMARSVFDANRQMPTKGDTDFKALKKKYSKGIELKGKNLGIFGFGRIGQAVASLGIGLGMNILPVDLIYDELRIDVDIFSMQGANLSVTVNTVSVEEMLANSDFITFHVPFTSGGKALVGETEFAKMKDGVRIVNAARGGVIDEKALLQALESGKVASAALDVFEDEPTPDRAILEHPRISLSPHIGASTVEAQRRIGLELADRIIEFFGI